MTSFPLAQIVQRLLRRAQARPRVPELGGGVPPLVKLPSDVSKALLRLQDHQMTRSNRAREKGLVRFDAREAHPEIWYFAQALSQEFVSYGVPMYAFEIWRSPARQQKLFEEGFSNAKGGQGPHNLGMAIDFVHLTRLWDLSREEWNAIGMIGKIVAERTGIQVQWGGDWRNPWDPAHWEIKDFRKWRSAYPVNGHWPLISTLNEMKEYRKTVKSSLDM